jgi:hypothetical protein
MTTDGWEDGNVADMFSSHRKPPAPQRYPLGMSARAWQRWDRWMDVQLGRLVNEWVHTASPNAQRSAAAARRGGAQRASEP